MCSGVGSLKSLVPTIEEALRDCRSKNGGDSAPEGTATIKTTSTTSTTGTTTSECARTNASKSAGTVSGGATKKTGSRDHGACSTSTRSDTTSSSSEKEASAPSSQMKEAWVLSGKEYCLEVTEGLQAYSSAAAVEKNVDVELGKQDVKVTCWTPLDDASSSSSSTCYPIPTGADVLLGAKAKWLQKKQKLVVTLRAKRS